MKKHALIWICYFVATYLLNIMGNVDVSLLALSVLFACYVGAFYLLNAIAHRYLTYRHLLVALLQLLASVALLYIAIYGLVYQLLPLLDIYVFHVDEPFHLGKYIRNMTHHLEPVLLTSSTYQLMRVAQQRKDEIYRQRQEFRIAAMQSRLKSHWFRNIWMIIRSGIINGDRSAQLFDLMMELERIYYRYIGADHALITLNDELEVMDTLAAINRLARPHEAVVVIQRAPRLLMRQMPALSLSTALENALKYGDLTDPMQPVRVTIKSDKDKLVFTCRNKVDAAKIGNATSAGTGLLFLQKQLDLFFPSRNRVHINNDEGFFTMTITIHF